MIKRFAAFLLVATALAPIIARAQSLQQEGQIQQIYKGNRKFSFERSGAQQGGEVRWKAARQEFVKEDYVILEGDVKITYQDITISADKVTHNLKTKDTEAQGHVILDQGPRRLSADRIVFNLDSKTGTLFQARASFEPSMYFTGKSIEKIGEDTYRLTEGVFTSCDLDDPAWSFRLKSGVVTVDDYARLRDIQFRAHKVPLFWTPYLVWPTKKERSRGFLVPKVGYSNKFGTFLGTAYFMPFNSWFDTTFEGDFYSNGLYGLGLNTLRYTPNKSTNGRLLAYGVYDSDTATNGGDKYKWRYEYQHTQEGLPGGFRFVVDTRDFSDLEFFRRFERKFEINTISTLYSSAYLTKNTPTYSLNLRMDRRKNFFGTESQVFEQTPGLEFRTYPNRIANTPVYFSMESSTSHLRTNGADYYRADVFPTLSLQLRTPPWFSVKPQISARETYYSTSLDPTTGEVTDESIRRSYAQAQVEIVGPSLSRIFNKQLGGFSKFKHVIEPRARYFYTSDVQNQNEVLKFDAVDSPLLPIVRDSVEYSLTQRLLGKGSEEGASAREILSFTLRQTASLSEPFNRTTGTSGSPGVVNPAKFTPVSATLHANPYSSLSLDATAYIGNESHQLDQATLSANLYGKDALQYMNVRWVSTFLRPGQTTGDSSQVQFRAGTPFFNRRLRSDISVTYDGSNAKFLEQRYLLGFFASCYNVSFEYRDLTIPITTHDYLISVNLTNVGTFVDLRGSFDKLF